MKVPLDRTKIVLRHLPPTISQSNLVEQVDSRFSGRYHWLAFRPGKSSAKHLKYSRAYIVLNKPEDVIEFAEFFNGHVFVNEKGSQFKTIVEYAPSQHVPMHWSKKDGREGTISKDPEYLEFLELLAKPVENLPSAEIQLERKEAKRAGAPKDDPVVTPLMDYVRQKRAAKGEARRNVVNGKLARRASGMLSRSSLSGSSKRSSEKKRASSAMETSKSVSSSDKPTYLLVHKQDRPAAGKSVSSTAALANEAFEAKSGGSVFSGNGKKKILLLKGKETEIPTIPGGFSAQQNVTSHAKMSHRSPSSKQNQQREASGRIIRSILVNARQPSSGSQTSNYGRGKKPPRSPSVLQSFHGDINITPDDNTVILKNLNATPSNKQDGHTRNNERPVRGVWPPLKCSNESCASDELLSSSPSQASQVVDSAEGTVVETTHDMLVNRGGRGSQYSAENGSHRHGIRRGLGYTGNDPDVSSNAEGKPLRRGGSSGYGSHEKQVWVQKSSSGT